MVFRWRWWWKKQWIELKIVLRWWWFELNWRFPSRCEIDGSRETKCCVSKLNFELSFELIFDLRLRVKMKFWGLERNMKGRVLGNFLGDCSSPSYMFKSVKIYYWKLATDKMPQFRRIGWSITILLLVNCRCHWRTGPKASDTQ
jgi:hypothetical protein